MVLTLAAVGYAAARVGGGIQAATVASAPSFGFVIVEAQRFSALLSSHSVQGFLRGAGPAALGAIAGSAVPLAGSVSHLWQVGVLALALAWLAGRRPALRALAGGAGLGVVALLAGLPIPR